MMTRPTGNPIGGWEVRPHRVGNLATPQKPGDGWMDRWMDAGLQIEGFGKINLEMMKRSGWFH